MFTTTLVTAQVKYLSGPELDNDKNSKVNRMIAGDDNSFYCYRIRSKGRGTSFFIEKYDKKNLTPAFSSEISLEDGDDKNNCENDPTDSRGISQVKKVKALRI